MSSLNKNFVIRFVFFLVILIVISFLLFNESGILKFLDLKSEIRILEQQIKDASNKLNQLESEIDSLKVSKEKIERVARERYNMLKTGEEVLKVEEK
ncbi:MAG: septum formation initiator family protein [Ignavibacteria bacterium]|nr:septum formation initiator family protein [Ignavibacteria bacterium]